MQTNDLNLLLPENCPPEVAEVCRAMVIEGARVLGFSADAMLTLDALKQILDAATSMVGGLTLLLMVVERDREVGN